MKTIRQNVEVNFHHAELKDAMIMEPLMAALAQGIENDKAVELYNALPREEQDDYRPIWRDDVRIDCHLAQSIYDVLTELGYHTVSKILSATDILNNHRK